MSNQDPMNLVFLYICRWPKTPTVGIFTYKRVLVSKYFSSPTQLSFSKTDSLETDLDTDGVLVSVTLALLLPRIPPPPPPPPLSLPPPPLSSLLAEANRLNILALRLSHGWCPDDEDVDEALEMIDALPPPPTTPPPPLSLPPPLPDALLLLSADEDVIILPCVLLLNRSKFWVQSDSICRVNWERLSVIAATPWNNCFS